MEGVYEWAKEHPWMAGALTLGAIFILLWLLGFFGGSSSSTTSSNSNNLAAAYYQAEAAQTTAGTQLQMATEAYAAQTAQDQIQATAAQGIATTQANMYTTIGGQNASTTTALGYDQLLATNNANADAQATALGEANFAYQTALSNNATAYLTNYNSTVFAPAYAAGGGANLLATTPYGVINMGGQVATPNSLAAVGYTPAQINQLLGVA